MWSCEGMYEKQEQYEGEVVYPAKYDTIIGHIGFERVEIDLMKAGRIPSSQIRLGKAKKTRIEYDDQIITIDSLVSWVNITGLTQSKLYRFKVYTIDEFGNESVPLEIALIPFTSTDLANYAVTPPRVMASPSAAVIDWPNGISSVLMNYYGLNFQYTDKNGEVQSGERGANSRFFIGNVEAGQPVAIDMEYKIIPIVNRQPILDTVIFENVLNVNMPTTSSEFAPAERDILQANGVTTFTADGVSDITELVYPIHANSLQDIFYFPNLETLDLTGGDMFSITELAYDRNGVQDVVGGGEFSPFMRKVGNVSGGNTLKDFLEAGILTKVYYHPHTMGLDDILMPYVASGVVELVENPDEVLVGNQFHLDGIVQDGNFTLDYTFPATDAPEGDGLENVYKLIPRKRSASFVIALPKEYRFNIEEYKYLKFKIYTPTASELTGSDEPFKRLWPRIMNNMWSFGGNSDYGQEYWDIPRFYIPDEDLHQWTDITLDMSTALGRHNRVIILNIGGEPGPDPSKELVYYFSNIRFTKE
ncbi:hypothetical protein NC99_28130 [Sunxiuqinia dokdonensis]|uniref:Uncharacterized protein n=2 Tax=Sunxiuqinia dokdonensis TaxID=1409788 RepID=A0A0L8V7E6_9BACT|nr:hypothetical protein NC99_28130 [Sunxiuqinia dokdonensis]